MTVPPGLHAFCRLALQGRRAPRHQRMLLPSSGGVSRLQITERLRIYYRITWTIQQVTAVIDALVTLGAVKLTDFGYRAVDWDLIEGLVADRVQPDVGEEVPA